MVNKSFSRRQGYAGAAKEIAIREDAPESLRFTVLETAGQLGLEADFLRRTVCGVLRVMPDPNNWSSGNVWNEVQDLISSCEWFKVYDIIEKLYEKMAGDGYPYPGAEAVFAQEINSLFIEEGIGWQLKDGQIVTRGAEAFESVVKEASEALQQSGRPTAAGHIHEALQDLSRRPKPDLPGAFYHAMGALECVVRDLVRDPKAKLQDVPKRHPGLLPKPLDTVVSQVWGYASNEARHVKEGQNPKREEAELVVGLAAAVATYLTRK